MQSLLDGSMRAEAEAAIDAIRRDLLTLEARPLEATTRGVLAGCGLASGAAGEALFFAYLSRVTGDPRDASEAAMRLTRACEGLRVAPLPPGLFSGYTGIAWTAAHLAGWIVDAGPDDPLAPIDRALLRALEGPILRREFDSMDGPAGVMLYARERGGVADAVRERAIAQLTRQAEVTSEGIAWRTRAESLSESERARFPLGFFYTGMAHGVAGVVAALALAVPPESDDSAVRALLDGGVGWLFAQEMAGGGEPFPFHVGPDITRRAGWAGWCHGDLGIAVALLAAGRWAANPAWESEALRIARRAAALAPSLADARQPGLCHGAAGIGHLFNRLYRATGDETCRAAARFWLERTLAARRPGNGVGGFSPWAIAESGEWGFHADAGLLQGSSGIGLALLAATSTVEPAWDRVFGVSGVEKFNDRNRTARE